MTKYTRERLIKICEKAFVLQKNWSDRDSADAQRQLGSCYALLKAGCKFEILYTKGGVCSTDENTIWIQFWVHDFQWFELGEESFEDKRGNKNMDYHFYLPTSSRLRRHSGRDWY